ncbi:MAG: hypothetical protein AB8B87_00140 [Granulosicoccus sp.]
MKYRFLIASVLFFGLSSIANAGFLIGVKAGPMLVGFDDVDVDEDPVSVGVLLGYDFDSQPGGFALEAEATRSTAAGLVSGIDLEVESQGLYLSYATRGNLYLKGRVGYMDASLVADSLSEEEGGETYGLAIGLRLGAIRVELDYTAVDDDVTFVSVGLVF